MWNSNGTFLLEHFIGLHHMAYVNLQAAAVKVTYQLPTKYTHVGYLLKPLEKTSLLSKRKMNVSQLDDHEVSQEELPQAITIRVTNHLYMAMSVGTAVDLITKLLV